MAGSVEKLDQQINRPVLGFSTRDPCSALRGAWCRPSPSIDKRGSQRFYQSNELAAHDRRGAPGRGHSRSRSSAARAVERSARPRALSLHAIAARPFHATEPAGEAALAVGLRSARRMAGKGAIAANATLLRGDACGVLAEAISRRTPNASLATPRRRI